MSELLKVEPESGTVQLSAEPHPHMRCAFMLTDAYGFTCVFGRI